MREKWKQDDTGQAVTSSAGAATDLGSSGRYEQLQAGMSYLLDEGGL